MPNYKPWGYPVDSVGYPGFIKAVPIGAVVRRLWFVHALAVTSKSVLVDGATIYVVPVGKKFVMVGLATISTGAVPNTINIHTGDTADAITTIREKFHTTSNANYNMPEYHSCFLEFAAGKYITTTALAANIYEVNIIGYEIDV